ncbi:hypothetical protein [Candidatus Mycoplasma mahonii]|uniref:hypothetical protein n=1 Tax=Candidatus Mycoplasma mahonii TaxID=3004105 RepID=UPI0026EDA418|nr:hypothetical protein [Candidatus Mycoplasma mahonii]WKX02175.1 hypothetical protein O3I44_02110 [Candidatus Mycoplasma mahonii]
MVKINISLSLPVIELSEMIEKGDYSALVRIGFKMKMLEMEKNITYNNIIILY